jgi:hypothetical protein
VKSCCRVLGEAVSYERGTSVKRDLVCEGRGCRQGPVPAERHLLAGKRCRANIARIRQSTSDSGYGLEANVLEGGKVVSSLLGTPARGEKLIAGARLELLCTGTTTHLKRTIYPCFKKDVFP